MRLKTLLIFTAFSLGTVMQVNAQTCRNLYREAKALEKQGKLDKAKTKYQQVVNCGDKLYYDDSKERINWIGRIQRKPVVKKPFSISDNEVVIPYQGGQDVITVDGNGTWRADIIDGENGWCKIKKEKGKIYIISEANENNFDRTCTVSVSMGGKSKEIKVKNEKAPEILIPSVENVTFPYNGETNTIEIHSNTDWEVKDVPGWVVSSKEDGKITLTALANENNIERKADIKIEGSSKTVIINIYQGAGLDHLAFSKNDLHFGPDGGDEYINIYTDAEDWRLGDFPHWCQVTKVADNMLRVHCTPNDPINLNREASVNVTTGKQMLGINVTQEAKPFVAVIPDFGIGGRAVSFGFSAGYVMPMISTSSGGNYTGSLVNYSLGTNAEEASYSSSGGFNVGIYADIRVYKNFYIKAGLEYLHYKYKNEFSQTYERKIHSMTMGYYTKGEVRNEYTESYTFNNITVPLLASYRIPVSKISHIQFNAGPVLSYGINAKMKIDGGYDGENIYTYSSTTNAPMGVWGDVHFVGSGSLDLYGKEVLYSEKNVIGSDDVMIPNNQSLNDKPYKRINFGARVGVTYEYAGISFAIEYDWMFTNMANKKFWESDRWMIFGNNAYSTMSGYKQHNNFLQIKVGYTLRY